MIRTTVATQDIIGNPVTNDQGENLGEIREIMIDAEYQHVKYVVLSFGGIFGLGEKFFAIPMSLLEFNLQDKSIILNLPKEVLKTAPGFNKNSWPETTSPYWHDLVPNFYEPYNASSKADA